VNVKPHTRSFAGGEITPELYGRIDLTKFQTGLAKCLNFWVLPHGPVQNRPGFAYVNEVKDSTKRTRVIPFQYNTQQTFAVEFGDQYIRWHTNGGTLLETAKNITGITQPAGVITSAAHGFSNGQWVYLSAIGGMTQLNGRFAVVSDAATNTFRIKDFAGNYITTGSYSAYTAGGTAARVYEIASTYLEADLMDLHFTQSNDVLTITHPSYPPRELKRLGATNWTLTDVSFSPTISAPSAPTVAVGAGAGATQYQYKVTAVSSDNLEESLPSRAASSASVAITGATQANPGVITAVAHGRAVGDPVYIEGVGGMTQLNGNEYLVNTAPTADTLTLKTLDGTPINTTGYGAYTAGGTLYFVAIANDLTGAGAYNTVSWTAVSGAVRYNIYRLKNGLYGYIGQTARNTFRDDNITPDVSKTPAEADTPFTGASNYPAGVDYYESRRGFVGTTNKPISYWLTRSATESNLSYSIPTRDDDRIAGRVLGREVNALRHIVGDDALVMLTSGGIWRLAPLNSDILTPSSALPKRINGEGSSNVQPVKTHSDIVYFGDASQHLIAIKYQWEANGLITEDLSIMAPHLFDDYTFSDLAYAKRPRMLWSVRNDGKLIGTTHMPAHEVTAMHQHDTDGTFESVCSVKEGSEYPVYAVIQRSINGRSVRYIERMHKRRFTDAADAFIVDAGATYDGSAVTTITNGLWHLEGETVNILADGAEVAQQVVTNGAVTLPNAASTVQIGLPITADLQGLPLILESLMASGQASLKNISEVFLRVHESGGIKAGPDFDHLRELPARTNENYDTPPRLKSGVVHITIDNSWDIDAAICIRQTAPLPLTISAMTLLVRAGGP